MFRPSDTDVTHHWTWKQRALECRILTNIGEHSTSRDWQVFYRCLWFAANFAISTMINFTFQDGKFRKSDLVHVNMNSFLFWNFEKVYGTFDACFGLLVTPTLGSEPGQLRLLACCGTYAQRIPQIHLCFHTCWPLSCQDDSWSCSPHVSSSTRPVRSPS